SPRLSYYLFWTRPPVAHYHRLFSCPIEPEKPVRSFGRRFSNFFQRHGPSCCDRFGDNARVRRFGTFSTKRNGRQIWAIGLDHKFPERDFCRDFSHGCAVFESDNSGERNEMVKAKNFIRLIERAAEAMKNATQFARVRLHDSQRVVPSVPLMDHNIEP